MFIKEEQYEIDKSLDFGFIYILKLFFRLCLIFSVILFVHMYIKYKDSIYDTVNGANIYISKSIIRQDVLIQHNMEQDFYNLSNCSENNISDLSEDLHCNLISSKNIMYVNVHKNDIYLIDYLKDKKILLCNLKINCKVVFIHNDMIIDLKGGD